MDEETRKQNLEKAREIRQSRYQTKIHASPHKEEIDKMIVDNRWSSRMVVKELERKYPNEDHPSDRAIDNYRTKYLPEEILKNARSSQLTEELREKIVNQFDPAMEGLILWSFSRRMMDKAQDMLDKTPVPPKFAIDLSKTLNDTYKTLCEEWIRLGLSDSKPQEFNVNLNRVYDPKDLEETESKISKLRSEIKRIEEEAGSRKDEGDGDSGTTGDDKGEGEASS